MANDKIKTVLFDADGVTITPIEPFSVQYAKLHGLDPKVLSSFFDAHFGEALVGKRDLKELLEAKRELWAWKGPIEDLLTNWFEAENHNNQELLIFIHQLRANGLPCYLAMNQEKYRSKYINEVMFPETFDFIYSSADIGFKKPDPIYYQHIIKELQNAHIIQEPSEIVYFDDSVSNVRAAKDLGLQGHVYTSVEQVKKVLMS